MAKSIKETPVLSGNDAKKFIESIKSSGNKRASEQERKRIKKNFDLLNSIAKF